MGMLDFLSRHWYTQAKFEAVILVDRGYSREETYEIPSICTALSLILLHLILTALKSNGNCSERIKKEKSLTYLDDAIEMIKKGKENYPSCHNKISIPMPTEQSGPALDCGDLYKMGYNMSGVYDVWPNSRMLHGKSIEVYCDMHTDGGGWTVIQRRGNFSHPQDYFYRDWSEYRKGFGNVDQDFWLGNDKIFALSNQKLYSIRFDLKDVEGDEAYAHYDMFWIDDESNKYTLHIKGYRGDAGDSMVSHDGNKFSTKDQDNDKTSAKCAEVNKGGWWYHACMTSNLNGLYLRGRHDKVTNGVTWKDWKGQFESMETTEIKIRDHDF